MAVSFIQLEGQPPSMLQLGIQLQRIDRWLSDPLVRKYFVSEGGFLNNELYRHPYAENYDGLINRLTREVQHAAAVARLTMIDASGQLRPPSMYYLHSLGFRTTKMRYISFIHGKHFKLVFQS